MNIRRYYMILHLSDLIEAFKYADLSQFGSHIYEIMTHREDNKQQHLKLYKKLSDIIDVTL